MPNMDLSQADEKAPTVQLPTNNEQAIIENVHLLILQKAFAALWRAKLRLQFTGWLQ